MPRLPLFLLLSIALNVLLAIAFFKGCNSPCPEAVITTTYTDTIYVKPDAVKPVVVETVPRPRAIHRKTDSGSSVFSVLADSGGLVTATTAAPKADLNFYSCADSIEYSDTIYRVNEYRLVIHELIQNNSIAKRKVLFSNLTPQIIQHIDKIIPQKELPRVYAGIFSGFGRSYTGGKWNWTIGPEVVVTIPQGLLVGYGFDAKNNAHQIQLLYKIKLKK